MVSKKKFDENGLMKMQLISKLCSTVTNHILCRIGSEPDDQMELLTETAS